VVVQKYLGRTIPSVTIALEMEKEERKLFRNALHKSERKKFDEMFDISESSYSCICHSKHFHTFYQRILPKIHYHMLLLLLLYLPAPSLSS